MISRRRFLQAGAAAGAVLAMPRWAFPFSLSVPGIKKFVVPLPGLVAPGVTTRGIPVLTKTTVAGVDEYTIKAGAFTQDLLGQASSLAHKTKLWGYADKTGVSQYLGGVIVAQGPTKLNANDAIPVRLVITNELPGPMKHILPTDLTLLDPVVANEPGMKREDKIAVHLHGGLVFWQFDGGPFTWFTSLNGGFDSGSSFIIGDPNAKGTAIYEYPNNQSARTIWYHDHAYGLTRTNVYAGLASAYLITDNFEANLITSKALPGDDLPTALDGRLGIPLVVQDKTFWDPTEGDPNYPTAVPGTTNPPIETGDLWYPHIYEGASDAALPTMSRPPVCDGRGRWGQSPVVPTPPISSVPEFFSDTILVNGAPYPTLQVKARRYRFRFINASQARFYNLQLYVADPDNEEDGITLRPIASGEVDNNPNVLLVPEPAKNLPGPAFIQVANEAGFLPEPVLFSTAPGVPENKNSNLIIRYKLSTASRKHRRRADAPPRSLPGDPTIGNVSEHNLLMAPAERPDVIIDFRGFEDQTLILYNDAPAPFPGGDIRNDYFVFNPSNFGLPANYDDFTCIGGAPRTNAGEGPDTRVLMQFVVGGADTHLAGEPTFAETVAMLQNPSSGLPFVFKESQPPPLTGGKTFKKTLGEDNDEFGRLRQFLGDSVGNPRTYLDFPNDVATIGETQVWDIYNLTADTHPMHFHLVNVQVLKRRQWDFDPSGAPVLPLQPLPDAKGGVDIPPDPNEKGWKDTVRMNPGEITTVAMKFDLPLGGPPPPSPRLLATYGIKGSEYVWHCHILEHEEHDMMHPIVVI